MRQPAYSRQLREANKAGLEPAHGLAIWLDRQAPEQSVFAALACFRDDDPAGIDWSLCKGRDVVIPLADECNPDRLDALIEAATKAGPRRLQLWFSDGRIPVFLILGEGAACPR